MASGKRSFSEVSYLAQLQAPPFIDPTGRVDSDFDQNQPIAPARWIKQGLLLCTGSRFSMS